MLATILVLLALLPASTSEPALSEQVRQLIDAKGTEAARQEMPTLIIAAMGEGASDQKGMLALADDYLEAENVDAAEIVLQLQMMIGNSADVTARLGDVYLEKGTPLAAYVFYGQALQVDPTHEHAKRQMAFIEKEHPELSPTSTQPPPPPEQQPPPKPPTKGGGLLPHVLVADPEAAGSLDWAALRKRAGTDYPSRWDDLTLLDSCLWIPPNELKEQLGLSLRLTARMEDFRCKYRVHLPNGDSEVILSLYVELHEDQEYPRKARSGFSTGVSGMQFTPFDTGAPDLNAYVNKKGHYLYAFPRDGRTYWRLGYMRASPERDEFYRPEGEAGIDQDLGPRFLRLLVARYAGRL